MRTIAFAGGGTAGHIEPALAVARQWGAQHKQDHMIFIGTSSGLENSLVPAAGFELRLISKVYVPRQISLTWILLPARLIISVMQARRALQGVDLLIGFGGYVSGPAYLAAWTRRIPIVIHDANARIGWANRMGSVFTSYLAVAHAIPRGKFSKARLTGLPLRSDVQVAATDAASDWAGARNKARRGMGWEADAPTLLILGGSQGSARINATIAQALPTLLSMGVQMLHSVGAKNALPPSTRTYKAVPYIDQMAQAYLGADVILARSGAVTCAEVGALGKLALFIPLSIGNGEQFRNADNLVEQGRAVVLAEEKFTSEWLISHLPQLLLQSSANPVAGSKGDLNAAKNIVGLMEMALGGENS